MDDSYQGSNQTLTAFFDSRAEAEKAIAALRALGIPEANVRYAEGTAETETPPRQKGLFEALADLFLPEADRYAYAEGLARGGCLVTVVDVPANLRSEAIDILDDDGAVDFDEREASWRAQGWPGYQEEPTDVPQPSAPGRQAAGFAETQPEFSRGLAEQERLTDDLEETVPIAEERLRVGRRDVNLGRVRVRSYIREEPVTADVELERERVEVERRPVDRPLEAGESAFEERVIEAEEHAEEPVVTKEARIVEEVGLRRERESQVESVRDTIRRTEVEIEDDRRPAPIENDKRKS
jgi:uncharacterized protein (TIGR02271 family)